MNRKEQLDISRKLKVLNYAKEIGNISKTCRYFGICRETFYKWKRAYDAHGEEGLISSKPCPENIKMRSRSKFKRYEKRVPGHHVQIDVKFLFFKDKKGKRIKKFQYTAIDDCTRIRALKIDEKHTQASSIDFINYVVEKFPFRIKMFRTDNGHEFQTKFHWHVGDLGIEQAYIKPGTPRLNGKVERSHLTDKRESYQVLDYKGDVDLRKKLAQWEDYYNFLRPHSAHMGKTPYEKLKQRMLG